MSKCKVSVVMSVFNGEKYLKEAVDSILNQTFEDFEFIIINDGSTDKTKQILEGFNDKRIVVINNPKNLGLTKSLNMGIRMAKGDYIARMDADDISSSERLEKEVEFLDENRNIGLVGTLFIQIDERGEKVGVVNLPIENAEIQEELLSYNCFNHGSVMFRREYMEKVGFYREEFKVAQDYDLWFRITQLYDVANIPEPLYKWRVNSRSVSVGSLVEQDKYAELARELARERKVYGKDRLQTLGKEEINKILENLPSKTKLQKRKAVADSHYFWGRILYFGNDYRSALRLLLKSALNNPLDKDVLVLILKTWMYLAFPKAVIKSLKLAKQYFLLKA